MSLSQEEKMGLCSLLSSIRIDTVTDFPVANVLQVPFEYMSHEVVYKTKDKFFGFTISEAIKESELTSTVKILDKNGMHYYYTPDKNREMLWMPSVYDTIKDIDGTVLVMQEFPVDGSCTTKYVLAKDVDNESVNQYLDKDVVIFNNANFYVSRETVKHLSKVCNDLWKKDILISKNAMPTFHANNIS